MRRIPPYQERVNNLCQTNSYAPEQPKQQETGKNSHHRPPPPTTHTQEDHIETIETAE